MKLTAYFAHPMSDYDTAQEKKDISLIESLGFECINPNGMLAAGICGLKAMQECLDIVAKCDILVFRAFPNGKIGAGVFKEIEHARKLGKPVIELYNEISAKRSLGIEETRRLIRHYRIAQSNDFAKACRR